MPQDLIYVSLSFKSSIKPPFSYSPFIKGGKVTYSYDVIDQISEAVAYFSQFNTDVKAQIGTVNSVTDGVVNLGQKLSEIQLTDL